MSSSSYPDYACGQREYFRQLGREDEFFSPRQRELPSSSPGSVVGLLSTPSPSTTPSPTPEELRVNVLIFEHKSLRERVDVLNDVVRKKEEQVSYALDQVKHNLVFMKRTKYERQKWKAELKAMKARLVKMETESQHRGEEMDRLKSEVTRMTTQMVEMKTERDNVGIKKPGRPPGRKNKKRGVYLPK